MIYGQLIGLRHFQLFLENFMTIYSQSGCLSIFGEFYNLRVLLLNHTTI